MKPSHLSTPRQLADCTFEVGHPEAQRLQREFNWSSYAVLLVCAGALACYFVGVFG